MILHLHYSRHDVGATANHYALEAQLLDNLTPTDLDYYAKNYNRLSQALTVMEKEKHGFTPH